jgi:hypothetical protein
MAEPFWAASAPAIARNEYLLLSLGQFEQPLCGLLHIVCLLPARPNS